MKMCQEELKNIEREIKRLLSANGVHLKKQLIKFSRKGELRTELILIPKVIDDKDLLYIERDKFSEEPDYIYIIPNEPEDGVLYSLDKIYRCCTFYSYKQYNKDEQERIYNLIENEIFETRKHIILEVEEKISQMEDEQITKREKVWEEWEAKKLDIIDYETAIIPD